MRHTGIWTIFFTILLLNNSPQLLACKKVSAYKTNASIRIDGKLDEEAWQIADIAHNFTQRRPYPGKKPSYDTEVKVIYNEFSVFVSAVMYDNSSDSIMRQLSARDEIGFADRFAVFFDTYHDGINAFQFGVTAAGVQYDYRVSSNGWDRNWNAAWYSEVSIEDDKWIVEMEIPFSALRFPSDDIQEWGVNFERQIVRKGELSFWEEVKPQKNGFVNQFGLMDGLNNIKPPLRLAVIPYMSTYYSNVNDKPNNTSYSNFNLRGGMDIKYGINDAFTLDMMLIPDFGQVISDNRVLNLSPYEIFNSENRQFFQEGTELFDKGNYLYTRRIGGKPIDFNVAEDQAYDNEIVIANPLESKIINATKVTGRTNGGLGIGILNATTSRTFATLEDNNGNRREVQTAPLINYNALVFDQSLKNNSYLTILNHNVTRGGDYYNSNLLGTTYRFFDRQSNVMVFGKTAWSQQYGDPEREATGVETNLGIRKVSGAINYGGWYNLKTDEFDANDLGYMRNNNIQSTGANIVYKLLEPTNRLLNFNARLQVNYQRQFRPSMFKEIEFETSMFSKFNNFLETSVWFSFSPVESYDFNEPRVDGRYLVNPGYKNTGFNIETDDRKKIRLRTWVNYYKVDDELAREGLSIGFGPGFRVNDKLSVNTYISADTENNNIGYVSGDDESINFGVRDVQTVTNVFSTKYAFNNTMDLFFRARHYWSSAHYSDFLSLSDDGRLTDSDYQDNHDVSFNAFNIDMVYTWVFSPASEFSVVWKNSIIDEQAASENDYFNTFKRMNTAPVENSISFRVLYYLDYLMLTKKNRNNPA